MQRAERPLISCKFCGALVDGELPTEPGWWDPTESFDPGGPDIQILASHQLTSE